MAAKSLLLLIAGELAVGFTALAITVSVLYYKYLKSPDDFVASPTEIYANLANPLTGWCPLGSLVEPLPQPFGTFFMNLTWRQIEPNRTEFQWDQLEKYYQFDRWALGKKYFVLRIVLDAASHSDKLDELTDLPDWLMANISYDGYYYYSELYDNVGFSPNYSHPLLIAEHERLINAVAERYANNSRLIAIQVGSIGHNGEWNTSPLPFPFANITSQYVEHYRKAFPNKLLQFFQPPSSFVTSNPTHAYGLHMKGFGNKTLVTKFTSSYYSGKTYLGNSNETQDMNPKFYETGPASGSFFTSNSSILPTYFGNVTVYEMMTMAKSMHMSYMGPNCPAGMERDGDYQASLDMFATSVGYRLVFTRVTYPETVARGNTLDINLVVTNRGNAPFYLPWPLEVSLFRDGRSRLAVNTSVNLKSWTTGAHDNEITLDIPSDLPTRTYNVCFAILDPSGAAGVKFSNANAGLQSDGRYCFSEISVQAPGISALVVGLIGAGIGVFTLALAMVTYYFGRVKSAPDTYTTSCTSSKVIPVETTRSKATFRSTVTQAESTGTMNLKPESHPTLPESRQQNRESLSEMEEVKSSSANTNVGLGASQPINQVRVPSPTPSASQPLTGFASDYRVIVTKSTTPAKRVHYI